MASYWWVNHKQTVKQERGGNYIWSPKRNSNGHRNAFYEFMREVAPGDVVFSYAFAQIGAVGVATSFAYDFPKPEEFGRAGANWADVGWRIDVTFEELSAPVSPREHMDAIRPLLPKKYSPLSQAGLGLQSVYLTKLNPHLGSLLEELSALDRYPRLLDGAATNQQARDEAPAAQLEWEEEMVRAIAEDEALEATDRRTLIRARVGQGLFRERVLDHEPRCRVTGVDRRIHLIASHCKPWRVSSNEERLDGENGLALTPSIDHLFDKGFITFEDDGRLVVSPVAQEDALVRMGVPVDEKFNAGAFSSGQRKYLDYHRDYIFKQSTVDFTT